MTFIEQKKDELQFSKIEVKENSKIRQKEGTKIYMPQNVFLSKMQLPVLKFRWIVDRDKLFTQVQILKEVPANIHICISMTRNCTYEKRAFMIFKAINYLTSSLKIIILQSF